MKIKIFLAAFFMVASFSSNAGTLTHHLQEIKCLARVIYHEARGEPHAGKLAVAAVTLNRKKHSEFPDTVCKVIGQPRAYPWYSKNTPTKSKSFSQALDMAYKIYFKDLKGVDTWKPRIAQNALFFNTVPFRYKRLTFSGRIGGHLFYDLKG